jgi:hypothetical protein
VRKVFAAALYALLCTPAFAAAKPAEIASTIKAEQPFGHGSLTWLMIKAYDADLWTDAPRWSMQAPFALTLTYNMSFSVDEIVSRSVKEMKRDNAALSAADLARFRKFMTGAFTSVKSGDEITGLHTPDGTTQFFTNGRPTGQIKDPDFAQAFFGIWLSPSTSEPLLRARLLRLK